MVCAINGNASGGNTLRSEELCKLNKALGWAADGDAICCVCADVGLAGQGHVLQGTVSTGEKGLMVELLT